MTPETLAQTLQHALGPDLRSVVLYGSAVAGEKVAATSDYNVLVIVAALPMESLSAMGRAIHDWIEDGNSGPLVFTEEEWQSSADVFPMEYADILEHHRVLAGDPPFAGIAVERDKLRLQVEQDARGKLLHLRQALLTAAAADQALHVGILEHTLSKLMVLYRAVLRLNGVPHPTDYEELTSAAAAVAGFEAEAVLPVVRHVRGTARLNEADAERAAEAYLAALQQLVRHLDQLG